ncbi:MAG: hypothetical protein WCI97_06445 [Bacteroidota bacterium]
MKKILILLLCFAVAENSFAQKTTKTTTPTVTPVESSSQDVDFFIKTYHLAMSYNDLVSATNSVYQILAVDTSSVAWKDTLASLFLMRGSYAQAVYVGKQLLEKQPDNTRLTELVAISLQSFGASKEALEYYEKLYPKTKNLYHLYQIIVLQYSLARLGECSANIDLLVQDPQSEKETIDINVGQGYNQKVPYKAAALNIKGVIAKQLNDNVTAEKLFNDALAVMPDFVLAKGNIEDLKKVKSPEQNNPAPKK